MGLDPKLKYKLYITMRVNFGINLIKTLRCFNGLIFSVKKRSVSISIQLKKYFDTSLNLNDYCINVFSVQGIVDVLLV